MTDTLHIAEYGDEEGFSFARFISVLGITPGPAATFLPSGESSLRSDWKLWSEILFAPALAPAFVEAFHCGIASQVDEAIKADQNLEKMLSADIAARSHASADTFFEGKSEMRGNREWVRFAEAVHAGESPGNIAVVFALQSALFHLPLPSALAAYAWFEFQSRRGQGIPPEATQDEKDEFSKILPHVAVAVTGKSGDFGAGSGALRSI